MPIYKYVCATCKKLVEELRDVDSRVHRAYCPKCNKESAEFEISPCRITIVDGHVGKK